MSRWGSNATWQALGTRFSGRKVVKSALHVALAGNDVVLGVQRDVVEAASLFFGQKRGQKQAPRRIGVARCRVGVPTRRGRGRELGFRAEKEAKRVATSHWRSAMSYWGSNATWLRRRACFSGGKGAKSARHVALEGSDVAMGVQRDVVKAGSLVFTRKRSKNRASRRIG